MRTTHLIPIAIAALAACAESPLAGPPLDDLPGQAVVVTRLDERYPSQYSGFGDPARIVVDDAAQWAEVWARLWNNQRPLPPLPAVDFAREVVIVAAMGSRPTGGYGVRVQDAAVQANQVVVRAVETSPGSGCVTTQAFTAPADVVKLPRTDRPVRFETVAAVRDCR